MGGLIAVAVCLFAAGCLYLFHLLDRLEAAKPLPANTWRYCPWCKGNLVVGLVGDKSKLRCSRCQFVHWDNPKPNAKTLIPTVDGGLVLILGLSGGLELPGGYVEPFETLEQGARRETKEETGLDVEIVRELAMIMPPRRNEHVHFFLTKPVSAKPVPGDDATEASVVPQTAVPFDRIKPEAHRRVIKQWLAESNRT